MHYIKLRSWSNQPALSSLTSGEINLRSSKEGGGRGGCSPSLKEAYGIHMALSSPPSPSQPKRSQPDLCASQTLAFRSKATCRMPERGGDLCILQKTDP